MKYSLLDVVVVLGVIAFCAAIVVVMSEFNVRGESHLDKVAREFSAACVSVNGKATWNGRNWECLK